MCIVYIRYLRSWSKEIENFTSTFTIDNSYLLLCLCLEHEVRDVYENETCLALHILQTLHFIFSFRFMYLTYICYFYETDIS